MRCVLIARVAFPEQYVLYVLAPACCTLAKIEAGKIVG